jgi:hypothetical protein
VQHNQQPAYVLAVGLVQHGHGGAAGDHGLQVVPAAAHAYVMRQQQPLVSSGAYNGSTSLVQGIANVEKTQITTKITKFAHPPQSYEHIATLPQSSESQNAMLPPQCLSSSSRRVMDISSSTTMGLFTWPEIPNSFVPVLLGRPMPANQLPPVEVAVERKVSGYKKHERLLLVRR